MKYTYHKGYLKCLFYTVSFLYNLVEIYIDANVKKHKQKVKIILHWFVI